MENLEDPSTTLLTLPTSNVTGQQTAPVANGAQPLPQVSLPTATLLATDPLNASPQLTKPSGYANPYGASNYPMSYNYQQNYGQAAGSYPATQQSYSSLAMNPYGAPSASGTPGSTYPHMYQQSTQQQPGGSTGTAQANPTSPSQLPSHAYNYAPYGASGASYGQSSYPISSQYALPNPHLTSHSYNQSMAQPSYQQPSGSTSLMTQMNDNRGLVLPKATTPRAGPNKRRRPAGEDASPKLVKPAPVNESDSWERGTKYQPTVRKRAKKNYDEDEEDDDIDDDIEEDDDDEMLQRTERKSSRERKPSIKGGEKEKKSSSSVSASPRVTPKKKEVEKVVEEEEEDNEVEQGNQEVEIEFPEDSLIETDEETHTKKYNKIIFNGTTYAIGDTIAFWPEGKKGRPPMGTIKSFSTDGENNTVDCCWFYRVEETPLKGKRRQKIGAREVFLSEHTDPNACESIWKKVSIKSKYEVPDLDEYIKEADSYYYCSKFNHLELTFEDL